jgi:hypothetical protein
MIQEEKIKKVCDDFSSLNQGQQDYILGIPQALVFANTNNEDQSVNNQSESEKTKRS